MKVSRDSYYKHFRRNNKTQAKEEVALELAREVRIKEPMVGCRKIYHKISPSLKACGLNLGRDKLFKILGERGMHIKRRKSYNKTTYSKHSYVVAPNLVRNLEIKSPNQVFVSDITYIQLRKGHAYLFLVTDLYSRKIVGFHLSQDLKHTGAISALKMAPLSADIIHHSDRGCQYCCHEFLKFLNVYKIKSSMTDEARANQNAVAERVNGILKLEFLLDSTFTSFNLANRAIIKAIDIYNKIRNHFSLNLKTPEEVYAYAA